MNTYPSPCRSPCTFELATFSFSAKQWDTCRVACIGSHAGRVEEWSSSLLCRGLHHFRGRPLCILIHTFEFAAFVERNATPGTEKKCDTCHRKLFCIELKTSDCKLKASREGSKFIIYGTYAVERAAHCFSAKQRDTCHTTSVRSERLVSLEFELV